MDFLALALSQLGGAAGGVETDTNQALWERRHYPPPSILPQPAILPIPPAPLLLFICFLLFVCPEAEISLCMLNSVGGRARTRACTWSAL